MGRKPSTPAGYHAGLYRLEESSYCYRLFHNGDVVAWAEPKGDIEAAADSVIRLAVNHRAKREAYDRLTSEQRARYDTAPDDGHAPEDIPPLAVEIGWLNVEARMPHSAQTALEANRRLAAESAAFHERERERQRRELDEIAC